MKTKNKRGRKPIIRRRFLRVLKANGHNGGSTMRDLSIGTYGSDDRSSLYKTRSTRSNADEYLKKERNECIVSCHINGEWKHKIARTGEDRTESRLGFINRTANSFECQIQREEIMQPLLPFDKTTLAINKVLGSMVQFLRLTAGKQE